MPLLEAVSNVATQTKGTFYVFLYNLMNPKFTGWELFLNVLFIIIVCIFSLIIYWDSINRKVAQTSRCKRQLDIYNKHKGQYVIKVTDRAKKPLYNVSYDMNQKNVNVECACNTGDYVNYFNNIPVKDMKLNKDETINKVCSCDQYYNIGVSNDNVLYDGEPGLLRYMTANRNSDFFDNLMFTAYA